MAEIGETPFEGDGELDLNREETLGRIAELEGVIGAQSDEIGLLRLQLEMLSATDVVTGLPNYTGLMQTIEKEVARRLRTNETFGLVAVEIPALRQVEQLGLGALHDALRHCGAMISAGLRTSDTVGRIDEATFVATLPMMMREGAAAVIGRIDTNLQAMPLTVDGETVQLIPAFSVIFCGEACGSSAEELMGALATVRAEAVPGAPVIASLTTEKGKVDRIS
jgi:diguanylate cyclase (GGDEF)-like protein